MGFRTLCFHSSCLFIVSRRHRIEKSIMCATDLANSLTVSMIKWDAASMNFFIRNNLLLTTFVQNLEWRLREKVKPAQATLHYFFFSFEMNSFALTALTAKDSFSSTTAVDFFVKENYADGIKHKYTHTSAFFCTLFWNFQFNWNVNELKWMRNDSFVRSMLNVGFLLVLRWLKKKTEIIFFPFFFLKKSKHWTMNQPNDDELNYEFVSLLLLALCACWQFITFPVATFERYSYVNGWYL